MLEGGEARSAAVGTMADVGFLEGVILGTRRELSGSGRKGEFYAFSN